MTPSAITMLMTSSTATRGRGGRGGRRGRGGEGQDGIGGGGVVSTGITGSQREQQTTPGVGGHRAVAQGSQSWGTWGERATERDLWLDGYIQPGVRQKKKKKEACYMTLHVMWYVVNLSATHRKAARQVSSSNMYQVHYLPTEISPGTRVTNLIRFPI